MFEFVAGEMSSVRRVQVEEPERLIALVWLAQCCRESICPEVGRRKCVYPRMVLNPHLELRE